MFSNKPELSAWGACIINKYKNYGRFATEKAAKEEWGDKTGHFLQQGCANSDLAHRTLATAWMVGKTEGQAKGSPRILRLLQKAVRTEKL